MNKWEREKYTERERERERREIERKREGERDENVVLAEWSCSDNSR